jgi:hypothetical protein
MLSEEQIKQIFFACENDDPEGLRADDVDIYEFARKVEEHLKDESAKKERKKCVAFVASLNPTVAKALKDWQG